MLSWLNSQQKEAVQASDGPMLIIAWAWSWKTKTLTHRIAYLLSKWVRPWEIVAVTFTNKAWDEMNQRVKMLLESEAWEELSRDDLPFIWTFHSYCVRILRSEIDLLGFDSNFAIYDTTDQEQAMKQVMEKLYIDPKEIRPKYLCTLISNYKNKYLSPEDVWTDSFTDMELRNLEIYKEYQSLLKQNNALDFDDLLFYTVKLFEKYDDVVWKYSNRVKYICIDEYQDTNYVQYLLIKYLGSVHKNICAIWDADQSIYSFRWADIWNILSFTEDYKDCQMVKLEQNYRSTQTILDAAGQVIENNQWRHEKKMWTDCWKWEKIKLVKVSSERAEGDYIAQEISKKMREDPRKSLSDFAVFYRSNAQSRAIEESFMRHGLIYKIIWWLKFYSRKEVKDIIAYLRFIENSSDSVSMMRIINTPARKIWKVSIAKLQNHAWMKWISVWEVLKHIDTVDWLSAWAKKSIWAFADLIWDFRILRKENCLSDLIDIILEKTNYLETYKNETSVESQSRIENIMELKSVAWKFDMMWEQGLTSFLEEVSLLTDEEEKISSSSVTLMTIHWAKWLEFNTVFVIGLEEWIFPSSRSIEEDEFAEEERRLAYVAITRARQDLYLLHANSRLLYWEFKNNKPSRFLWEISSDLLEEIDLAYWWGYRFSEKKSSNWVNVPSWARM